ncbi:MAG: flagellar hook-associated protein FlgL [Pseudomonadota bacterium]
MRTSTSLFFRQATAQLNRLQAGLTETQLQISTGRRILNPADDPVASAQISTIEAALEQNAQFQSNAVLADSRLAVEETTLIDVQNALFRLRDLAIQANNDTQTFESRRFIAVEAEEVLGQLVELGNRRDGQNNFVFGGFRSRTQPFSRTDAGVTYNGDEGERRVQIGPSRFVVDGDSGATVFMNVPNGNGEIRTQVSDANTGTGVINDGSLVGLSRWTGETFEIRFTGTATYDVVDGGGATVSTGTFSPGDSVSVPGATVRVDGQPESGDVFAIAPSQAQDVFTTAQNFVDALRDEIAGPVGGAVFTNRINNVLSDLDQGIGVVLDTRARVGSRLQAIENQQASNEDFNLTLQTTRSELQDVDFTEAISRLNQQLTSLQAAQQSFVRIQGLSLFDVL